MRIPKMLQGEQRARETSKTSDCSYQDIRETKC